MSIDDILVKLEKATGPDRELDHDIDYYILTTTKLPAPLGRLAPRYSESIDAALTLVPEWMTWTLGQNVHHKYWQACVNTLDSEGKPTAAGYSGHIDLRSPALALCIAALKARMALNAAE